MRERQRFPDIVFKAIVIVCVGFIIGVLNNTFSQRGIRLVGNWNSKVISDSLIVPHNYEPEDPEAVTLSQALKSFESKKAIFVDCRLKADFDSGHITGAVNLPWEEFEVYFPQLRSSFAGAKEIIAYCDGTECELSLLLARELAQLGYNNIRVFFGGWVEWTKAGLPVERGS
jgi:rhodanese-related sulfurtransferase